MPEKRGGLTGRVGRRLSVEFSSDGTNFEEIPGISNFSIAEGEATSDTTSAFEGSFSVVGEAPIGDITFTVVSYIPNHQTWQDLKKLKDSGGNGTFRITTPLRTVFGETTAAAATVAITKSTGKVVLGTDAAALAAWKGPIIQRGMTLLVKGQTAAQTIKSISDDTTPAIEINDDDAKALSGDIAAANYSVILPSLRWGPFSAAIKQMGSTDAATDTAIGSSLIITPASPLDLPTAISTS